MTEPTYRCRTSAADESTVEGVDVASTSGTTALVHQGRKSGQSSLTRRSSSLGELLCTMGCLLEVPLVVSVLSRGWHWRGCLANHEGRKISGSNSTLNWMCFYSPGMVQISRSVLTKTPQSKYSRGAPGQGIDLRSMVPDPFRTIPVRSAVVEGSSEMPH